MNNVASIENLKDFSFFHQIDSLFYIDLEEFEYENSYSEKIKNKIYKNFLNKKRKIHDKKFLYDFESSEKSSKLENSIRTSLNYKKKNSMEKFQTKIEKKNDNISRFEKFIDSNDSKNLFLRKDNEKNNFHFFHNNFIKKINSLTKKNTKINIIKNLEISDEDFIKKKITLNGNFSKTNNNLGNSNIFNEKILNLKNNLEKIESICPVSKNSEFVENLKNKINSEKNNFLQINFLNNINISKNYNNLEIPQPFLLNNFSDLKKNDKNLYSINSNSYDNNDINNIIDKAELVNKNSHNLINSSLISNDKDKTKFRFSDEDLIRDLMRNHYKKPAVNPIDSMIFNKNKKDEEKDNKIREKDKDREKELTTSKLPMIITNLKNEDLSSKKVKLSEYSSKNEKYNPNNLQKSENGNIYLLKDLNPAKIENEIVIQSQNISTKIKTVETSIQEISELYNEKKINENCVKKNINITPESLAEEKIQNSKDFNNSENIFNLTKDYLYNEKSENEEKSKINNSIHDFINNKKILNKDIISNLINLEVKNVSKTICLGNETSKSFLQMLISDKKNQEPSDKIDEKQSVDRKDLINILMKDENSLNKIQSKTSLQSKIGKIQNFKNKEIKKNNPLDSNNKINSKPENLVNNFENKMNSNLELGYFDHIIQPLSALNNKKAANYKSKNNNNNNYNNNNQNIKNKNNIKIYQKKQNQILGKNIQVENNPTNSYKIPNFSESIISSRGIKSTNKFIENYSNGIKFDYFDMQISVKNLLNSDVLNNLDTYPNPHHKKLNSSLIPSNIINDISTPIINSNFNDINQIFSIKENDEFETINDLKFKNQTNPYLNNIKNQAEKSKENSSNFNKDIKINLFDDSNFRNYFNFTDDQEKEEKTNYRSYTAIEIKKQKHKKLFKEKLNKLDESSLKNNFIKYYKEIYNNNIINKHIFHDYRLRLIYLKKFPNQIKLKTTCYLFSVLNNEISSIYGRIPLKINDYIKINLYCVKLILDKEKDYLHTNIFVPEKILKKKLNQENIEAENLEERKINIIIN